MLGKGERWLKPVMMVTPADNPLDVYSDVEHTYREGKHILVVSINKNDQNRVGEASVNAITRKGVPHQLFVVDYGYVLDTGVALTITPTDDPRVMQDTVEDISTKFVIKGVSGDPITITKKCLMCLNYTNPKGERRQYMLTNCYLCDSIRTPLVCATQLINQGFEIHLTPQGHSDV
jgi:hypothetical protein